MSNATLTYSGGTTSSKEKIMFWSGWILSILPCIMLFWSVYLKLSQQPKVIEGFTHFGWPLHVVAAIGVTELVCTVLYLIPQTTVLGAILLTGYMGGAVATHVRIEEGFASAVVFGVVLWLGVYLREPRLRALVPFRTSSAPNNS